MGLISLSSERRVRDLLVPELPVRATREEIQRRSRPGPWPRSSLRARSGEVVQVHLHVAAQELLGQRSDAIRGPAILRRVYMADDQDVGAASPPDNWRRVDFSETAVLQTFTFNGDAIPDVGAPDGVTLFPHVSFRNAGGELLRTGGWWLRSPSVADPEHILVWEPYLRIPYPVFWVKQYCQNDEAATIRLMGMYFFEVQEGEQWDARQVGGAADYIPVIGV